MSRGWDDRGDEVHDQHRDERHPCDVGDAEAYRAGLDALDRDAALREQADEWAADDALTGGVW